MAATPLHLVDCTMFWTPSGGGVRRYLLAKQQWLAGRADWTQTIATPSPDSGPGSRLPGLALPGLAGYRVPWRRDASARVLRELKPALIEAGDPYRLAWAARDAAQSLGIPCVAFCHSDLERMAIGWAGPRFAAAAARAARRYLRHVYAGFDRVLAPSLSMRDRLLDWGIANAVHQPLGVDTGVFHPGRADRARWLERLGLPPATRLLVYAGRLASEKHLDRLVAAVDRLGEPYRLLLIGDGPSVPQGRLCLHLPHLRNAVELASAMASADAFVHAGDQETFGLAVLEALACGTPVVARHAAGLAELVDDDVGCSVPGGRPADFAAAISALFERDRVALAASARRRAEHYDWQQVLPGLMTRYEGLLSSRHNGTLAAAASTPNRP